MQIQDFIKDKTVEFPKTEVVTSEITEPTKAQLNKAYNLLLDVQGNNGYTAIARVSKLKRQQVKELHRAMIEKASENMKEPTTKEI